MKEFIAIDFETATGSPHSAVSVGLVRYRDYRPVEEFYSLIRPPRLYIRPDFTAIHGLTVDDVKDSPDFAVLWESKIRDFIGGTVLAAHYAVFDMKVLSAVLEWYELPIPGLRYFCTCVLSRRVWPHLKSHALTALAKNFGIVYDAHNALADAMTCGKLVQLAAEKFGTGKNIAELLKAAGMEVKKMRNEE